MKAQTRSNSQGSCCRHRSRSSSNSCRRRSKSPDGFNYHSYTGKQSEDLHAGWCSHMRDRHEDEGSPMYRFGHKCQRDGSRDNCVSRKFLIHGCCRSHRDHCKEIAGFSNDGLCPHTCSGKKKRCLHSGAYVLQCCRASPPSCNCNYDSDMLVMQDSEDLTHSYYSRKKRRIKSRKNHAHKCPAHCRRGHSPAVSKHVSDVHNTRVQVEHMPDPDTAAPEMHTIAKAENSELDTILSLETARPPKLKVENVDCDDFKLSLPGYPLPSNTRPNIDLNLVAEPEESFMDFLVSSQCTTPPPSTLGKPVWEQMATLKDVSCISTSNMSNESIRKQRSAKEFCNAESCHESAVPAVSNDMKEVNMKTGFQEREPKKVLSEDKKEQSTSKGDCCQKSSVIIIDDSDDEFREDKERRPSVLRSFYDEMVDSKEDSPHVEQNEKATALGNGLTSVDVTSILAADEPTEIKEGGPNVSRSLQTENENVDNKECTPHVSVSEQNEKAMSEQNGKATTISYGQASVGVTSILSTDDVAPVLMKMVGAGFRSRKKRLTPRSFYST